MTLSEDVNLEEFVMAKDELSGADIKAVCTEAGLLALRERRMRVTQARAVFVCVWGGEAGWLPLAGRLALPVSPAGISLSLSLSAHARMHAQARTQTAL